MPILQSVNTYWLCLHYWNFFSDVRAMLVRTLADLAHYDSATSTKESLLPFLWP